MSVRLFERPAQSKYSGNWRGCNLHFTQATALPSHADGYVRWHIYTLAQGCGHSGDTFATIDRAYPTCR
ncbi:hypothetical protein J6590_053153 [Homalodisca vitripennis]|nr:hypothetical protein J6590_053153 [Homalodisca vitripennis]